MSLPARGTHTQKGAKAEWETDFSKNTSCCFWDLLGSKQAQRSTLFRKLSQRSNATVCSPAKAILHVSTQGIAYQFIIVLKLCRLKKVTIGDPHAAEFIVVFVEVACSVWVTTNEVGDGVKSGDLLLLLMIRETEGGRKRKCEVYLQSLRS